MADSYWKAQLAGLEATTFPDLTGKSSSAKKNLTEFHCAERKVILRGEKIRNVSTATCLTTCAKVLALFLGETDFCVDHRVQLDVSKNSANRNTTVPIRLALEPSSSIHNVQSQIESVLRDAQNHGSPSEAVLTELLDSESSSLSDVLVIIRHHEQFDQYSISDFVEKYAFIIEFEHRDSSDEQVACMVKIHYWSSHLLSDDTQHFLSAFEAAFADVHTSSSTNFFSWSFTGQLQQSVSNPDFKPSDSHGVDTVHAAFEKHAIERPDDIALDFLGEDGARTTWTFEALNSMADRIAEELISTYHVKVEDSVPICVTKSPAFYASILGVLKAGGVFTPFSGIPQERQKFMLEELKSKVVLRTEEQDITWAGDTKTFNITSCLQDDNQRDSTSDMQARPCILPSNLCYQMYTSGSTGRPKAVSLEHENAVQTACATSKLVPWKSKSRMLQQAGVTFDMCYFETFFAWNVGICLCSAPDSVIYNQLSDVINSMQITLLGLTPSVALTLDPEQLPGIEWMYCIGEALPQSLADAWEGRLVNSYGPTEAAQMVTLFPVDHNVKSTVIGQPFENTSFTILRKNSVEIVPMLGIGELCIGGFQVARGYYRNPEKTRQAFIEVEGRKFYRTGDLVRMLGNGNFEFIGRVDDQVKVRGQRVELGEINKAIEASDEAIQRACTQILKVTERSKSQLVAFVVLNSAADTATQDVVRETAESYLTAVLPAYMIPKLMIFVDKIPLSLAGKVDKRALTKVLRESDEIKASNSEEAQSSSGQIPEIIRQIYSEFCGLSPSQIGLNVSIYQLGIDSINAIQIAHQLRSEGFRAQASDVLNYSTISKLSTILEDQRHNQKAHSEEELSFDFDTFDQQQRSKISEQCNISSSKIAVIRPASPLQSGMIAQSTHSSGSIYFNHLTYQLPDNIDLQKFLDSWDALISRHEILRSGFAHVEDTEFPIAMVTYHARSLPSPVRLSKQTPDLSDWRSEFTESAIKNLHLPPWQVLVSAEQMKFYFSAHHALYDAQVLELVVRDLAIAYDGMRLPKYTPIEPYLSRFLQANSKQAIENKFWKSRAGLAAVTKFPQMSPLLEESRETRSAISRSSLTLLDLDRGCRKAGVTMQAAGQAAWGYLLGALTGEEIVTFGTVLSGRIDDGSEEVGFPMITTVPTSVNVTKSRATVLNELLEFNANVQQNQFVGLNKIQRLIGHTTGNLFDTVFTYQKRSHKEVPSETKFCFLDNKLAIEYPVSVELEPTASGHLQVSVFHLLNYMPTEQAKLLAEQFQFILENIISENDLWSAPTVHNADHRLFSITHAIHDCLPSQHSLLHHAVEHNAKTRSNHTALEFITSLDAASPEMERWSYMQLDREGNKVAHLLQKLKVSQGSIVAICFDKCPDAAFAMLGILKAGCSFLALDPGAPNQRKEFIMQDSQAPILFTNGALVDELQASLGDVVFDLKVQDLSDCESTPVRLDREIDPQDTAYCLYTSGTTGTPKGCLVTHENVVQVFLCFEKLYDHNDQSRWLQFASYHFDVAVMEHFWSWFVGMTVVKAGRDLILQDLPNAISRLNITHIDLTPSLARLLDPDDVPSLAGGVFVTGGEMLRSDIIQAWGESGAIHNAYGPTEATIGVTMYRHVPKNGRPSNIGWPFHVVGVLVVNPSKPDRPVLRGGIGELLISGKLVAKGYLRREDLTKQRFITVAGMRCYRTGDLVRILSDGSIDFIGRADDQVKLRGQRLETGEINSVIKQRDSDIDDVTTLVLKHPKQQKEQLVSFVSVNGVGDGQEELALCDTPPATEIIPDLRSACNDKLPGYMVPTHILLVNRMPLSANNKVDGKQLKSLYEHVDASTLQTLTDNEGNSSTANDEDIQKITKILSRSLGIESDIAAPSTNFFELGLDSISIIGFSRALKGAGYKSASPSMMMKNPTITKLAAALTGAKSEVKDGSVKSAIQKMIACKQRYQSYAALTLGIDIEEIETIMPCTPLQAGIISRSLESNQGLYFAAFSFALNDSVDLQRLQQACQQVCGNVQMLRTKFIPTDDGYIQVVLRELEVPWVYQKVASNQQLEPVIKSAHQSWRNANECNIERPFELFLASHSTRTILTLHIFHALYDGNSLPLIMDAVVSEYHGASKVTYGPTFADAMPYGPLREAVGAKAFWIEHLSPLSNASLTNLKPIMGTTDKQDTCVLHRIEPLKGLEKCRRKLNVTHQALLQTCWGVLLQDIMSGPMVLGVIVSGRSIDFDGADGVIGPLFNTIPFLLAIAGDETWGSAIVKSHEFNTASLAYQHTPLRDIQRWTRKQREGSSLFETLFVFQKELPRETDMEPPWTLLEETFEADYPVALEVEQTIDGGFNLTLACQAHMCSESASQSLLQRFEDTLTYLIDHLDSPISETSENKIDIESQQRDSTSNGRCNGYKLTSDTNGTNGHGVRGSSKTIKKIRDELAALSDVSQDEIHDGTSIFELGLDSIDAVKLSSRLKKVTDVQLPVSQIMKLLTLTEMATAIDSKGTSNQKDRDDYDLGHESEAIQRSLKAANFDLTNVEQILPCTPLQEGMVADMLNSNFERYLNFDVLKLHTNTDIGILKKAWTEVVKASSILRTRFVSVTDPDVDYTFAQVVMNFSTFEFEEVEHTKHEDFSQDFNDIRKHIKNTFHQQPGLRLTIIHDREDSDSKYLILTLPHAMYDGSALGIIHDLVEKAYHGGMIDVPANEPALANILKSSGDTAMMFWRQNLDNAKVTQFPFKQTTNKAVNRAERTSNVLLDDIQTFCKQSRVTVAALCQSVWSIVLAYHTGQLDVSFAQVLSGRTDEATNSVVFPTMNTVISRAVLHGTKVEMARYVQDSLSAVSEHQHFPLRRALAIVKQQKDRDLFNSLFIFQKSDRRPLNSNDRLYESVDSSSNVEYPVCVEAEMTDQELIWRTACDSPYLDEAETNALLEILDQVLSNVVTEPEAPVVEFIDDEIRLCGLHPVRLLKQANGSIDEQTEKESMEIDNEKWSTTEQTVREVVASVAKVEISEITKRSSLLGVGLDSISTIKVASLLRKKGLKASVNDILSASSLAKISQLCEGQQVNGKGDTDESQPPVRHQNGKTTEPARKDLLRALDQKHLLNEHGIDPGNVEELLPVTAGQILLLSRWQNEGVYYSSLDFSCIGCHDVAQIRSAWSVLVQRSPMLRTVFIATGQRTDPVVQVVLKNTPSDFTEVPAGSSLDEASNSDKKRDQDDISSPCALYAQNTGKGRFDFVLKISHALYDGFSLKWLIGTLQDLINNPSLPAPKPDHTFSSYVTTAGYSQAKRNFWVAYLSGLKSCQLPSRDLSENELPAKQLHFVKADILPQLASLRNFARKHQVSVQSLLLASYAITHAQRIQLQPTQKDSVQDVLVGIFMANRNTEGADEIVAPTLGFAPVRVRQPLGRSLTEIASNIQEDMREISEDDRGQIGLRELEEWSGQAIKVDVWVNILRQWLPDIDEENQEGAQVVTGEKSQDLETYYEIKRHDEDTRHGLLLKNNAVRAYYDYPMMDLEATVKDDNLDIGIQAPTTLLDTNGARKIIQDVAKRLIDLCTDANEHEA